MGSYNTREILRESLPAINLVFSRISGEFVMQELLWSEHDREFRRKPGLWQDVGFPFFVLPLNHSAI